MPGTPFLDFPTPLPYRVVTVTIPGAVGAVPGMVEIEHGPAFFVYFLTDSGGSVYGLALGHGEPAVIPFRGDGKEVRSSVPFQRTRLYNFGGIAIPATVVHSSDPGFFMWDI